jgi:DNA-binding protein H-NS
MSVDKLAALREQVEAAIATKVVEERRTLQAELGKLSRYSGGGGRGGARGLRGGTVAPKYRNPANPSETWAGRGLRPRWLAAALKSGKKLEDFAIAGATRGAKKK